MLKLLLGAASLMLAIGVFIGIGSAAHDGGTMPYQSVSSSSGT